MMLLPPNMYSYFSVRLKTGKEYYEREGVDWDWLVHSGDVHKIAELRLHCPNGETRILAIDEPGTAFQLKRASVMQGFGHMRTAHLIGRIDDLATGACTCFIWDYFAGLIENYHTNFHDFKSWRRDVDDIGALSPQAQGMEV